LNKKKSLHIHVEAFLFASIWRFWPPAVIAKSEQRSNLRPSVQIASSPLTSGLVLIAINALIFMQGAAFFY